MIPGLGAKKGVRYEHRAYRLMAERWTRCRDCFEGSDAVKAQGVKYLPALESHKSDSGKPGSNTRYNAYKYRALFYNAFSRTVGGLSGIVFQKAPEVKVPTAIEEHLKDITLAGETAEMFWLRVANEVMITGRYGILIDMPSEEADDIRPYSVGYEAERIKNWTTRRYAGDEVLVRVVLLEHDEEPVPDDEFAMDVVEQYRVLELVLGKITAESPHGLQYQQRIFREKEKNKNDWVQYGPTITPLRRGLPLSAIPFVFVGSNSVSAAVEKPPLDDLSVVVLSHYCTMADLEHGRHIVALPTPWISGVAPPTQEEGADGQQEEQLLGPSVVLILEKGGQAGMLEFTGQGLGALETADEQKRKLMATLGAKMLEEPATNQETATAVAMRHSGEHATMRTVAQALETAFTQQMRWHAWWMDATKKLLSDLKDLVAVALNKDFFVQKMTGTELKDWVFSLQAGAIAFPTYYQALERGGVTRPGVDAEQEKADIEAEEKERIESMPLPGEPGGPLYDPNDPNLGDPDDPDKPPPAPKPRAVPVKKEEE